MHMLADMMWVKAVLYALHAGLYCNDQADKKPIKTVLYYLILHSFVLFSKSLTILPRGNMDLLDLLFFYMQPIMVQARTQSSYSLISVCVKHLQALPPSQQKNIQRPSLHITWPLFVLPYS